MERMLCAGRTPAVAVRLGAILESSDSVLERWRRSAVDTRSIDVTDPEMTRFVMTGDEALAVLMRAADDDGFANHILAPAIRAYRLGDLADVFANAHGLAVAVTGVRPGENLHDHMVSATEAPFARLEGGAFVITPGQRQRGVTAYSSRTAPRLDRSELARRLGAVVGAV
jgi:UDP-glucose 4-epimerase